MEDRFRKTLRTTTFWGFFIIFLFFPIALLLVYRSDIQANNTRQFAGHQETLLKKAKQRVHMEFRNIRLLLRTFLTSPDSGHTIPLHLEAYFRQNRVITGFAITAGEQVLLFRGRPGSALDAATAGLAARGSNAQELSLQVTTLRDGTFLLHLVQNTAGGTRLSLFLSLPDFLKTYLVPLVPSQGTIIALADRAGTTIASSSARLPAGGRSTALRIRDPESGRSVTLQELLQLRSSGNGIFSCESLAQGKRGRAVLSWDETRLGGNRLFLLILTEERHIREEFYRPNLTIILLLFSLSLITGYLGIIYYKARTRAERASARASTIPGLEQNIAELDQAKTRYSTLFNALMDGIIIFREDGKIIESNQAFADMLGYSPEELAGSSRRSITPPKYWRFEDDEVQTQLVNWGFTKDYEKEFIRKDGSLVPVIINSTLVKDQATGGHIILSTLRDISAQKRADREIEKLHKHLQNIVESSPSAIITLDGSFTVVSFNASAEEFFRLDRARVLHRNLMDSIPFFRKYSEWLEKTIAQKKTFSLNSERYEIDGYEEKYTNITFYPLLFEEEGSITIHLEEITEQVQLEQQLIQSQKLEALGTLASGFAHDFNNLLAGLFSYISVLRMQATSEEMQNSINVIDDISKKATALVKQILTFSRSSKIHAQPVSMKAVADDVLTILSRSIPDTITIVNTIPAEPEPVLGDPSQLSQVLLNLIINARDAMPEGGELRLEFTTEFDPREIPEGVEHREHMARVTVSDTGTGIDPDIRPKIFDPFFTTKRAKGGTGLGLPIAFRIVEEHGGTISVSSTPGVGTVFTVSIPAGKAAPGAAVRAETNTPEA